MGKDGSRLVEALIRCVQIAIERMGFGQGGGWRCLQMAGGVVDVSIFDRRQARTPRETITLSLWHACCQKGTPCPPAPSVGVAGTPRNFFSLFYRGGLFHEGKLILNALVGNDRRATVRG